MLTHTPTAHCKEGGQQQLQGEGAARSEAVSAVRAKAEQLGTKRKKDAPGEGCQPIDPPGRGMMVELGLAPRCPSPGEMTNETETLPDEVHHDTLPGEGREVHVFVPTGYIPTGGGCTAMWKQVAPGEWICHNPSDAVEGIESAHREEPEPELRFVAPMPDISGRNEGPQLTVTGECTTAGSLTPARSDGGNSAANTTHQSADNLAHQPVPGTAPLHSPVEHKTEVSNEPEQAETPQLPVRVINLVGPDSYANPDAPPDITISFDTSQYTPPHPLHSQTMSLTQTQQCTALLEDTVQPWQST